MCAMAVDHLASYIFQNMRKTNVTITALRTHMSAIPGLFADLLSLIINLLLYDSRISPWSLSRPLLSLMLIEEESFQAIKEQIVTTQPAQRQRELMEAFEQLTEDIELSLQTTNRDKFTQRVNTFRQQMTDLVIR